MSLIIIFGILIILLLIPVGIGMKYDNGAFVLVKIAVFSFEAPINKLIKKSKKEKTEKKPEDVVDESIAGVDFLLSLLGNFRRFIRKRFELKNFNLDLTFGTADAASTAVLSGHLWSLSYNLLGLIDKVIYVNSPKVNITPQFNNAMFSLKAEGIISTRIANIIATAVVIGYKFLKYKINKTRRKKS